MQNFNLTFIQNLKLLREKQRAFKESPTELNKIELSDAQYTVDIQVIQFEYRERHGVNGIKVQPLLQYHTLPQAPVNDMFPGATIF